MKTTALEMRIMLKSRIPLPHLHKTRVIHDGIFNIGGFELFFNGQTALVDWTDAKVNVELLKDGHLVMIGILTNEWTQAYYEHFNEDRTGVIPYEDIYRLQTWENGTLIDISYEAYERSYDDEIIPMNVESINLAVVDEAGCVLENINYHTDKLNRYNESPLTKWRTQKIPDPLVDYHLKGVLEPCHLSFMKC